MSKSAAVQAISIVLQGYPTTDSADREAFIKLATRALSDYPDDLLGYLADPARGIVRTSKFIPTIAECVSFMDAQWDRQRAEVEFRRREAQRKLPPADEPLTSPETRERIVAEFDKLLREIKPDPSGNRKQRMLSRPEIVGMANMWLDAYQADPTPLPKLSVAARKAGCNG